MIERPGDEDDAPGGSDLGEASGDAFPEPPSSEDAPPPEAQRGIVSASPAGSAPPVTWEEPTTTARLSPAPGVEYAGIGVRVAAYLIDATIIALINIITLIALDPQAFTAAPRPAPAILSIAAIVVDGLYFIGFWLRGWHATPGQRLASLRVVDAATRNPLAPDQAVRRWVAMGALIGLVAFVPSLNQIGGLLYLVWLIALLVSAATSPTRQGFHDRFANSVVVRPAGASSLPLVIGCGLLLALLILAPFILLAAAGDQLREILSQVGNSI